MTRKRAPFPAPATSHVACGFPALRVPAHFTTRVMGPIGWERSPRRAVDKPLDTSAPIATWPSMGNLAMRKAWRKSSRKPLGKDGVSTGPLCEPQPVRRSSRDQLVEIPWLFHISSTLRRTEPPLLYRVVHRRYALNYTQGRFEPDAWGNIRPPQYFANGLNGVVLEFSEPSLKQFLHAADTLCFDCVQLFVLQWELIEQGPELRYWETRRLMERPKRAVMPPKRGLGDVSLSRQGSRRMILRKGEFEMGNSGLLVSLDVKMENSDPLPRQYHPQQCGWMNRRLPSEVRYGPNGKPAQRSRLS